MRVLIRGCGRSRLEPGPPDPIPLTEDAPLRESRYPYLKMATQARVGGVRWTHGFAEDTAEAVVLAVANPVAAGRIYNVGEAQPPTVAKRLADFAFVAGWRGHIINVPASELPEPMRMPHDFAQHLVYDTSRIRRELGYSEVIPYEERSRARAGVGTRRLAGRTES